MLRVVGDFLQQQHPEVRYIFASDLVKRSCLDGLFGAYMQRENIRNETIYELTLGCFHSTVSIKRFFEYTAKHASPIIVCINYFTSWKKQTNHQFSQCTWCSVATHSIYIYQYIQVIISCCTIHDTQATISYRTANMIKHGDLVFGDPSISTSLMFCSRTPYERGLDRDAGCPAPHRRKQRQLGSKQQWPMKQNWVIKTRIYEFRYHGGLLWILRMA